MAGDALTRAWIVNPAANSGIRAALPDVQSVRAIGEFVEVESAGLSLHSFGPLEANQYEATDSVRHFVFHFPIAPKTSGDRHVSALLGVIGAFVTGVPIYNPIGTLSFNGQNLWHADAVAAADDGRFTRAGHVTTESHANGESPLLAALIAGTGTHSPLIGYALDGYPIYGPFGWDGDGGVRRMHSGYRLRSIKWRQLLPDGVLLTPAQEGPEVSAKFPLGTFVEDYEYAPGLDDLDQFNGRFCRTPEYPQGTYAYFLSTTDDGKLTYPYLIGPRYFGAMPQPALARSSQADHGMELRAPQSIRAGELAAFTLTAKNAHGPVRFLEMVHERPIHLIVVSEDLSEFAHIHPEPAEGDSFSIVHTFAHGGHYTLYADFTPPGSAQTIARFEVAVEGARVRSVALGGVSLKFDRPPRVGEDATLRFDLPSDLDPYLGAWAHIMIISADRADFIHAHPTESTDDDNSDPWQHTHAVSSTQSPAQITAVTGFRQAGLHKIWLQYQRNGQVITAPFVVDVAPSMVAAPATHQLVEGAIAVTVSSSGFAPARIELPAGKAATLVFKRTDAANCASEVVIPELNIRKNLPAGEPVEIKLPAMKIGELRFGCGMGMYRGALVLR